MTSTDSKTFRHVLKRRFSNLRFSEFWRAIRRDLLIIAVACLVGLYFLRQVSQNSLAIAYIIATFVILFPLFEVFTKSVAVARQADDFTSCDAAQAATFAGFYKFVAGNNHRFGDNYAVCGFNVLLFATAERCSDSLERRRRSRRICREKFCQRILSSGFGGISANVLDNSKTGHYSSAFSRSCRTSRTGLSLKEISLEASSEWLIGHVCSAGLWDISVSCFARSWILSCTLPRASSALNILNWVNFSLIGLTEWLFYMYRMILASREIKVLTGQITFQTADEIEGWTDGLYYYNRMTRHLWAKNRAASAT